RAQGRSKKGRASTGRPAISRRADGDGAFLSGAVVADGGVEDTEHGEDVGVVPPAAEEVVRAEADDVDAARPYRVGQEHDAVIGAVGRGDVIAPKDLIAHAARDGYRDDVEYRDRVGQPQRLETLPAVRRLQRLNSVPAPAA